MLKRVMFMLALGMAVSAAPASAETTPFDLSRNFLRQIGTFEHDRTRAARDQAADKADFAGCVRNMTTFQIDLHLSATYLLSVKLSDNNMAKAFPALIGAIVKQKYAIVGEIMKECEAFITRDPKVDYAALSQRAPKLTAMSDYVDKTLFESSPGMFATLISPRADSKNRANHLTINRVQRDQLLQSLALDFGDELNMTGDNVPYYVAIAQLFRDKLNEFKCADDPWE